MACVDLTDVGVDYPVYSVRGRSLKAALLRGVGGRISATSNDRVVVQALRNISLSIRPGDRVAVLGGNGSGKSTLLRVMAGIMEPPSGVVRIEGRVSALLDMSMGMDLEATGYENIYMRSAFLGIDWSRVKSKMREIEEFSGLGDYLSLPMRTYSSGMVVRLSFAISTLMSPDILILDEFVGVADAAFTEKARTRIRELALRAAILVYATHDLAAAQELCTRGIVLQSGDLRYNGSMDEAAEFYRTAAAGSKPI